MKQGKWTFFTALAMVMMLMVTACGPESASDSTVDDTQTATINIESEPPQLNSLQTTDVVSMNVLRHVQEGLTKLDKDNKPIPGIAEKWEVSDDNLIYTFHLRDAKWSDGTAVKAADFEFGWKTILSKDYGAPYAYLLFPIKGAAEYNGGSGGADGLGIKVVDDTTLQVTLTQPTAYFPFLVSSAPYLPVNEAFYNKQAKDTYGTDADKLIYNGPWKIEGWEHNSQITLVKNADYYDAANIKLDKVNMKIVGEPATAYNMFVSGELDSVTLRGGDQIAQAKTAGYDVLTKSDGATAYFVYNLENSILKNKNIRTALTLSIDRKSLIDNVLKDTSVPALSFTNPDVAGENGSFKDAVGDLIKDNDAADAKTFLEQGLKELGLSAAPELTLLVDDRGDTKLKAAAYQEFWKKNLGLSVKVETMPYKAMLSKLHAKDFQIAIGMWGPDYNDPMTFLDMFTTGNGNNNSLYADSGYDELIHTAAVELDASKRFDLLKQAETKLMQDLPIGPIYFQNQSYVVQPKLKGVVRSAFQDINLYSAYIEKQ
ncbi:peptide ABC transporter substrate-binding protein [Paenibacillus sp. P46E]|uniref:peptide ABC transporter substrate-binding protein n=1 Tax=Paenibacillus sp. P46E TaxID=1349436 RepID=UPI00093C24BD|nr:peptide ABC transporter substrate-binding protein [Paenibacillus sp. P46E]OKP95158.1 hypothetical protein A3849_27485 [Paenibacillus sp. P46E]